VTTVIGAILAILFLEKDLGGHLADAVGAGGQAGEGVEAALVAEGRPLAVVERPVGVGVDE
jgi:hypothetical protein